MMITNTVPSATATGAAAYGASGISTTPGPDGSPSLRQRGGQGVGPVERIDNRHDHHRSQRAERAHRHERDHGGTRATLQIKVAQAFQTLASTPGADAGAGTARTGIEASVKLSASDGGVKLRLKLEVASEGRVDDADFESLMSGFVDTLQAALHSMFAAGRPVPAAPGATADGVAALPAPTTPSTPTTPTTATTSTAVPSPASDVPGTGAAAAPDAAIPSASASSQAAAVPVLDASPSQPQSLSIHVRMAYQSFDSSVGSLIGRLAQPDVVQTAPGVAPMLQDLGAQFGQLIGLLSASTGSSGATPSLGGFLSALAGSYAAPAAADAGAPTEAALAPAAPSLMRLAFSMQASVRGSLVEATA